MNTTVTHDTNAKNSNNRWRGRGCCIVHPIGLLLHLWIADVCAFAHAVDSVLSIPRFSFLLYFSFSIHNFHRVRRFSRGLRFSRLLDFRSDFTVKFLLRRPCRVYYNGIVCRLIIYHANTLKSIILQSTVLWTYTSVRNTLTGRFFRHLNSRAEIIIASVPSEVSYLFYGVKLLL